MADRFVAVAGSIGVGKTTLTTYLTERYGFEPMFEPFATNPYLDDFYGDMRRWAFHSQIWFLSHKYRLHCDLERAPGTIVQDRTIYEDAEIFATNLYRSRKMPKSDYETYMELYRAMRSNLAPPDLLIYLKCSVRAIRRRIKQRGRPAEQAIPASYLRRLNGLYDEWMESWDACPVLVWDTEKMDYLGDLVDRIEFNRAIERFVQ